ncbi:MAG: hypothetical protein ACYCRD_03125 [Leptospirillum sp.]
MTEHFSRAVRVVRHVFFLIFLFLIPAGLLSCGQGPQVPSSTGHYLFVSDDKNIYSFSIFTNNTIQPVSTSSQQSAGSTITGMVYVKTPGSTSAPTLYAIDGSSSITAFPVTAGGLGSPVSLSPTCSPSISAINAITATPGGNYLLVAYTSSAPSYVAAALTLSNNQTITACKVSNTTSSTPTGISIDCAVTAGQPCNGIVTFTSTTVPPLLFTWTRGSNPSIGATSTATSTSTSEFSLFSLSTGYFYLFSPSKLTAYSILGNNPTSNPAATQTIPSVFGYSPCLDLLANNIYLTSTNGSIYQVGIQSNGSMGGSTQLWNLGDTPSLNSIGTCAVGE